MGKTSEKVVAKQRRRRRVRKRVKGTAERPRLAVTGTNAQVYAQVINDVEGATLAAASSIEPEIKAKVKRGSNVEAAKEVGRLIAERAVKLGVKEVVFDRGAALYHGRVAALADAAREAGLTF